MKYRYYLPQDLDEQTANLISIELADWAIETGDNEKFNYDPDMGSYYLRCALCEYYILQRRLQGDRCNGCTLEDKKLCGSGQGIAYRRWARDGCSRKNRIKYAKQMRRALMKKCKQEGWI